MPSWGFHNNGDRIKSAYIMLALSGARNWAEWLHNPCFLGSPTTMGTTLEWPTSSLLCRGPGIGRNGYITTAFLGVPQQWGQHQKWLHHPCFLGDPKLGGMATYPLPSWGSPNNEDKIKSGYITPAFLQVLQQWGQNQKWQHNLCLLGGPPKMKTKSEVATSSMLYRGPGIGRNGYITPAFSEVPHQWRPKQKWLHHPCFLGGPELGGMAT